MRFPELTHFQGVHGILSLTVGSGILPGVQGVSCKPLQGLPKTQKWSIATHFQFTITELEAVHILFWQFLCFAEACKALHRTPHTLESLLQPVINEKSSCTPQKWCNPGDSTAAFPPPRPLMLQRSGLSGWGVWDPPSYNTISINLFDRSSSNWFTELKKWLIVPKGLTI